MSEKTLGSTYPHSAQRLLIAGAVFFIPLAFSPLTLDPVLHPRFLALSLLTFCLMGDRTSHTLDSSVFGRAVFPLSFCGLLISALSLTNAVNLSEGVFEWLKGFLFFAFLYVATPLIGSHGNAIPILSRSMSLIGTVLALMGICQYHGLAFTSIPGNYTICATMAHKNLFASALFLILPFSLYGAVCFSRMWRILAVTSSALILFAIFLSRTRAVWLAILVSAFAIFFMAAHKRGKAKTFLIITVTVGIVLFSLPTSHFPLPTSPIFSTESLKERMRLWQKTSMMITYNPLLGVGAGQWRILLPCYGRIEKRVRDEAGHVREVWFQRPHNEYLRVLSETGIGGLLCHVSVFLTLIVYALRVASMSRDRDGRVFSLLMFSAILGYMAISFFSFPGERIAHNVFLMLISACLVSAYHRSSPPPRLRITNCVLRFTDFLFFFLLCLCILFGYARLMSDMHTAKALSAREAGRWERVIAETDKAESPFFNMDAFSTPLSWHRGMANLSLDRVDAALRDFEKAHASHPCHIHVLNNLGACHALSGNHEMAVRYFEKALRVSPGFGETLANLDALCSETRDAFRICREHAGPAREE